MSEVAELATTIRISDPNPGHCSACLTSSGPDVRFVDMQCMFDAGSIVDSGGAVVDSMDELHLCESCVRSAAETLALRPDLHARQLRRIDELELAVEHWQAYAKRIEGTLATKPEPVAINRPRRRS